MSWQYSSCLQQDWQTHECCSAWDMGHGLELCHPADGVEGGTCYLFKGDGQQLRASRTLGSFYPIQYLTARTALPARTPGGALVTWCPLKASTCRLQVMFAHAFCSNGPKYPYNCKPCG